VINERRLLYLEDDVGGKEGESIEETQNELDQGVCKFKSAAGRTRETS